MYKHSEYQQIYAHDDLIPKTKRGRNRPPWPLKPRSCAQFAPGCKFAPGVQICTRGVFLAGCKLCT